MMASIVSYGLLGLVAGVLAGLLGVGGGIVIVPMLVFAFGRAGFPSESIMLLALATSLGSIMFTSVSSALAHWRRGAVDWLSVLRISPGIVLGTFAGTYVAVLLPRRFLQIFFVIFLTYVAVQMLRGSRPRATRTLPGAWGMGAAGGVIGLISSLVGIGGGTLSVPFLTWHNVEMHRAIGTSAAIGLPIAVAGCCGYLINGLHATGLPPYCLGYLYLPALFPLVVCSMLTAPLGARIAHRLPVSRLRSAFALLLICVGIKMLLDVL
ncbi:sulfite exporter TauE/SafE family protein [uncultured Desulfovibrio sp.]|uniref:sulfite exporter TauE/SafE family protein n=1 Tax=uncultured Desulfovibrio sp. TaxID=167968 RepID=UPI0025F394D3|nr:sulfite exporter TauE/SafE family protein [uncultured Desulfovibrio sp.]